MIGLFGGAVALLVLVILMVKYFPKEVSGFFTSLRGSSTSAVKKQSDEMLGEMDRNVAERKAKRNR
jgi:hypothetical protein